MFLRLLSLTAWTLACSRLSCTCFLLVMIVELIDRGLEVIIYWRRVIEQSPSFLVCCVIICDGYPPSLLITSYRISSNSNIVNLRSYLRIRMCCFAFWVVSCHTVCFVSLTCWLLFLAYYLIYFWIFICLLFVWFWMIMETLLVFCVSLFQYCLLLVLEKSVSLSSSCLSYLFPYYCSLCRQRTNRRILS
jgi:hypothetical protein